MVHTNADPEKYFNLFKKHITGQENNVMLLGIGDALTLKRFIEAMPVANITCVDHSCWTKFIAWKYKERNINVVSVDDTDYVNIVKSLDMKFDKIIMNPPYDIGNKVVQACLATNPQAEYIVLMPLAQYKKDKLFQRIKDIEFVGGDAFGDASITLNNAVVTLGKSRNKSYQDFQLKSCSQEFIDFYNWNIEHNIGLAMNRKDSKSDIPLPKISMDTDFVDSGRCCAYVKGNGYFPKNSFGYYWNVDKVNVTGNWPHCAGIINFKSKKAKDNFSRYAYNWSINKYDCLASKTLSGLSVVSISADYFYFIPQIDWENIDQNKLWQDGKYDEAVLEVMGLEWDDDKMGVHKKCN